jgi:hypothetical protein
MNKAILLLNLVEKFQEAFFLVDYKSKNSILDDLYYFKLDDYSSLSKANSEKNKAVSFRKSKIRPYGKWYNNNFQFPIFNISLFGILSFNKSDIYNHSQKKYLKLMTSLEGAINDELSHYFERSWEAIVYPMKSTISLNYTHQLTNWIFYLFILYLKYKKNNYRTIKNYVSVNTAYWNFVYFLNRYSPLLLKIRK